MAGLPDFKIQKPHQGPNSHGQPVLKTGFSDIQKTGAGQSQFGIAGKTQAGPEPLLEGDDTAAILAERARVERSRFQLIQKPKLQLARNILAVLGLIAIGVYVGIRKHWIRDFTKPKTYTQTLSDRGSKRSIPRMLDSLYRGRRLDQQLNTGGQCQEWVQSLPCLMRATQAFRVGKDSVARKILDFGLVSPKDWGFQEQVNFQLMQVVLSKSTADRQKAFKSGLQMIDKVYKNERSLSNLFTDDIVNQLAVRGQFEAIRDILKISPVTRGKWKVFANLDAAHNKRVIDQNVINDQGPMSLRSDPIGFVALTERGIAEGYAGKLAPLGAVLLSRDVSNEADPYWLGRVQAAYIKVLLALGKRSDAGTWLLEYQKSSGQDIFWLHHTAGLELLSHKPGHSLEMAGSVTQLPWQTEVILGMLEGQRKQFGKSTQRLSRLARVNVPRFYKDLLVASLLVNQQKYKSAIDLLRGLKVEQSRDFIALEILQKAYEGLGRNADASKTKNLIDQLKGNAQMWIQSDILYAPYGPLALIEVTRT
jgi:hypothetical protein